MSPLALLAGWSLRSLLRGRRLAAAGLLAALPVGLALVTVYVGQRLGLSTLSGSALYRGLLPGYFHMLTILLGILFGTSAVRDDEEDGSVVYLLVRPVRRGVVYLGKVAAAVVAVALVVVPAHLAVWLALASGRRGVGAGTYGRDVLWLLLASLAYPAAFAAVATLFKRPLLASTALLFFWELPLALAPTGLRHLTVSHQLLSLMPHTSPWHSVVKTFGLSSPPAEALLALAALIVAWLVAGSLRYERKEHLPSAEA